MLAKVYSAAVTGLDVDTIEIEVNATGIGLIEIVSIVGLPDMAVKESRHRVKSALLNQHYFFPDGETVINLAPAGIKKEGASFDLPIALGLLACQSIIPKDPLDKIMIIGELALNGDVRPITGMLPIALHARTIPHIKALLVPTKNAAEAVTGSGDLPVYAINNLYDAVEFINKRTKLKRHKIECSPTEPERFTADFADVKGQTRAKRALEIAAAGSHNLLMIGPPGTGKSMLAQRLPSILPPLTEAEMLETSKIHSILGKLVGNNGLLEARPFCSPHHTISNAGLIGGGINIPRPGQISLAHNGVLFLDEIPEFKKSVLEVLRQPLESGCVTLGRSMGSFTYPSRFILISAMNPCPCGHYGSLQRECRCSPSQVQKYRAKLSGPLLDRIDLHVEVNALSEDELINKGTGEPSTTISDRVHMARSRQTHRFTDLSIYSNSELQSQHLPSFCKIDKCCENLLRNSIRQLKLSARAYDRILRVSRTIADLNDSDKIEENHIYEAVTYRTLDKQLW